MTPRLLVHMRQCSQACLGMGPVGVRRRRGGGSSLHPSAICSKAVLGSRPGSGWGISFRVLEGKEGRGGKGEEGGGCRWPRTLGFFFRMFFMSRTLSSPKVSTLSISSASSNTCRTCGYACVRACVHACVRACAYVCVCICERTWLNV